MNFTDPNTKVIITGLIGAALVFLGGLIGNWFTYRQSLPQMARNAFDMANEATQRLKEAEEKREKEREEDRLKIEAMQALMDGRIKFTGFYSQANLLRDGFALIDSGRVEMVSMEARKVSLQKE